MILAAAATQPTLLDQAAKAGPIATGLAAVVALIIGWCTIVQRSKADRRDQWWKRTQWALEQVVSNEDARMVVGFSVLAHLADSKLAEKSEIAMLEAAWKDVLDEVAPAAQDETEDQSGGEEAQ